MADNPKKGKIEKLSIVLTKFSGSTPAFIISILLILFWAVSGPFFGYSEVWQLIINTGTTVITFLMVFIIQRTQNKDSLAIQLKLNELIAATAGASNRMVDIEDISEAELEQLENHFRKLARLYEAEFNIRATHSIEEAEKRHKRKAVKK